MLKWINTYFGNAYVRYFVFFFWCENLSCNNACTTDETTLFFVIYDLWFHKFVMLKPTLNNLTIPDSILILKFIVINYFMFWSTTLTSVILLYNKCQKHGKKNSWSSKSFVTVVGLAVFGTLSLSLII